MVRLYESPGRAGAGHLGPGSRWAGPRCQPCWNGGCTRATRPSGYDRSRSSHGARARSDYLRPTPLSPMWKILWLSRAMSTTSLVVVLPQVRVTTASV